MKTSTKVFLLILVVLFFTFLTFTVTFSMWQIEERNKTQSNIEQLSEGDVETPAENFDWFTFSITLAGGVSQGVLIGVITTSANAKIVKKGAEK